MFVPFHDDGIISQFEGYADLQELDWDAYRAKYGNIQRLDRILHAEGADPNRYKVTKQADTVMLFSSCSCTRGYTRTSSDSGTTTVPTRQGGTSRTTTGAPLTARR
jgi:trehalose/maltose hydrolase-like predicted phosphorylase